MDILDQMTKEELVVWLRENLFYKRPKEYEILHIRWKIRSDRYFKAEAALSEWFKGIDLKKRDELARQFNETTDIETCLDLLNQMRPYDDAVQKYFKENDRLSKEWEAIEKLRDRYQKAFQKSSERQRGI